MGCGGHGGSHKGAKKAGKAKKAKKSCQVKLTKVYNIDGSVSFRNLSKNKKKK